MQEYVFPEVKDRLWLKKFYKGAKTSRLDIHRYNDLKNQIAETKLDIERLRDPLQLQLPVSQITKEQLFLKQHNQ